MRGFPNFARPLGIEVTDSHIKLCELNKGKGVGIRNCGEVQLTAGTMNDGRLADEGRLLQALRYLLQSVNWPSGPVHFAVPSQLVMVRPLKLPDVDDKTLRKLVEHEVKHHIHFPFDDPHYDFVRLGGANGRGSLPEEKLREAAAFQAQWEAAASAEPGVSGEEGDGQRMCDVMLTAASLKLLTQYVRIFEDLGLKLRSMEIKAFSLNRLQRSLGLLRPGQLGILADVNDTACELTIVEGHTVRMTRNIQLSFRGGPAASVDPLDAMFADIAPRGSDVEAGFSDLAAEIERLMNFYRYSLNHREAAFDLVLVSGDISMLDELLGYLSGRLPQRVAKLAAPDGRDGAWDLARYAVPLGLALRGRV